MIELTSLLYVSLEREQSMGQELQLQARKGVHRPQLIRCCVLLLLHLPLCVMLSADDDRQCCSRLECRFSAVGAAEVTPLSIDEQ